MSTNPFDTEVAARLYAAGRPDYSSVVSEIIRRLTEITARVSYAVDVGCGTGISTMALAPLTEAAVGVEPSPEMLEQAPLLPGVVYRVGTAEDIPVPDGSCELIMVGSALHWFDQTLFLSEASRIAKPDASLVVVDHWFTGEMRQHNGFGEWMRDVYLATYPPPPRDRSWRPPDDLGSWRHTGWERYEHSVPMTADQLASYLLTQSNLQTVIASDDQTEDQLRAWLTSETAPFFTDAATGVFVFGGFVACHRRSSGASER